MSSIITDWDIVGGLIKNGAGNLVLSGSNINSFTGGTTVNAGTLTLAKSHAANPLNFGKAIGGLTINPGSIVRLGDDGQIRDDATVSITSATLDLQSFDDTVGTLNLANASVVGTAGSVLGRLNSDAARTIASTGNSSISTAELFGNGNIPINVPSGTLTISSAITNFAHKCLA